MQRSDYRYSYSGADTHVYVSLSRIPSKLIPLDTISTVSVSVHEAKGPARSIGYRNVKGFANSLRTVAGSIIFSVLEDHPLREILKLIPEHDIKYGTHGWSVDRYTVGVGRVLDQLDFKNQLPTMLPPFDLLLLQVAEGGTFEKTIQKPKDAPDFEQLKYYGAATIIEGIELIDDGSVISVHDSVPEMTFSFQAYNFRPMSKNEFISRKEIIQEGNTYDTLYLSPEEQHRGLVDLLRRPPTLYPLFEDELMLTNTDGEF